MLDIVLRIVSVAVLVGAFHQVFLGRGGNFLHVASGKALMVLGAILVILVALRSAAREESMTILYAIHLWVGGAFFLALFRTGYLGWKMSLDRVGPYRITNGHRLASVHRTTGRVTFVLLILTLGVGVISRMSH